MCSQDPIKSEEHFIRVYQRQNDHKLRMAVMVYCWNLSTQEERFASFVRFLDVVGGSTGGSAAATEFAGTVMATLPTHNHCDVDIPQQWLDYYSSLDVSGKVRLMESMYGCATGEEKGLIIRDLQHFIQPGDGNSDVSCSAAASGAATAAMPGADNNDGV